MPNVVLLFPGQGSQSPGMGKELAARFPVAREVFLAADDAINAPLSRLCFEGPEEALTLTLNAQPALLTHGAAVWAVIRDVIGPHVVAAAGHSLGEFTAYHAAGAIPLREAVQLVRTRGQLMYDAGVHRPGGMAAILGETNIPICEVCEIASEAGVVVPANFNAPGQVVVSGEDTGVERAMAVAKEHGAKRTIKLKVSGAFHSPLMDDASAGLKAALDLTHLAAPDFPIYSNVNAQPVAEVALARQLLLDQLTLPVQWTREVEAIASRYPDALYVEMGPGHVLRGLVRKIHPTGHVIPCSTAADVDALFALVTT